MLFIPKSHMRKFGNRDNKRVKFEVKFHTHPYTQIVLERSHVVRLEGPGIDAT